MAINLNTNATIAGRVTPVDLDYPYASSKNETTAGARDGTPYFKARADDLLGFMQGLLRLGGIVPTGNADTARNSQYIQAIEEIASGRAVNYDESGVVNAYVLDLRANQQGGASYFDGMIIEFTPTATNTGASTVNVNSLGVKNITDKDGVDVIVNAISGRVACRFDLLNDRFVLLSKVANQVDTDAGANDTDFVTPKKMRFGFSILLAQNGYIVFPSWMGGLILQWGNDSVIVSPSTVTFPIAFTAFVWSVVANPTSALVGNFGSINVRVLNASSFTMDKQVNSGYAWIAIGY